MEIDTRVHTNSLGDLTLYMKGGLSYDNINDFQEELYGLLKEYPASSITLNFSSLEFVGSSGINLFVDTIKKINMLTKKQRIHFTNVNNEFAQVFKLYDLDIEKVILDFDKDIGYSKVYEC